MFQLIVFIAFFGASLIVVPPGAHAGEDHINDVRRLSAILDYVAGDYGAAVVGGSVVDAAEYAEQTAFLEDAASLASRLPTPLAVSETRIGPALSELKALIEQKAPAETVSRRCRALRAEILSTYGVVIAPTSAPSFDRAAALFTQHCTKCHGDNGAGDGPSAAELKPPPRSFHEADVMASLSPVRAFNALTDGIAETGMASFDTLSPSDRWSLAFYVFTLRYATNEAPEIPGSLLGQELPSLGELANATDQELIERKSAEALPYLRSVAPLGQGDKPIHRALALLSQSMEAYRRGDRTVALHEISAAYLDGFEPTEAMLATYDPRLLTETESAFHTLREKIASGSAQDVDRALVVLQHHLNTAQALFETNSARHVVAFTAAATVLLREGIEAVLLVLLLLSLVRQAGTPTDLFAVRTGVVAALAVGVTAWFASGALIAWSGLGREVMEGLIALLAAGVLLYASHFVLARLDAKRRVEVLRARFAGASAARRNSILFTLAFFAVFREIFEIVLFLRAILIESPNARLAVAGGAGLGILICVVIILISRLIGRRMNVQHVMTASGAMLTLLSVVMVGKGIRALQEAGWIAASSIGTPKLEWLGVYPTWQTTAAQMATIAVIILLAWMRPLPARAHAPGTRTS